MCISFIIVGLICSIIGKISKAFNGEEVFSVQTKQKHVGLRLVRVALPIIENPVCPPDVIIEFEPARIPAAGPKIIVISSRILLNVVAEHPDGRKIQLKRMGDSKWISEFTISFYTPEGPYPFTFWITDEHGRHWYFQKSVMIDNSIPNLYAEFTPKIGKGGSTIKLKAKLLIDAKTVMLRFRGIRGMLYLKRAERFYWSTDLTIPKDIRAGLYYAQVVVVPKEDCRLKHRVDVAYRVE
jgi:hypothetical protein